MVIWGWRTSGPLDVECYTDFQPTLQEDNPTFGYVVDGVQRHHLVGSFIESSEGVDEVGTEGGIDVFYGELAEGGSVDCPGTDITDHHRGIGRRWGLGGGGGGERVRVDGWGWRN